MTTATRRRFVRVNNPSYPEFAVGYEEGNFTSIKVRMVWSLKYFECKIKKNYWFRPQKTLDYFQSLLCEVMKQCRKIFQKIQKTFES